MNVHWLIASMLTLLMYYFMKHFLLLTLLLLTACWKTPQNSESPFYTNNLYQEFLPKSSWADLHLHGKVKKLTEYSYYLEYADNGQIQQGALSTIVPAKVETFFTSQGRISTQLSRGYFLLPLFQWED